MFVISPKITLNPGVRYPVADEYEWAIDPDNQIMQHSPSRTTYQINVDRTNIESSPLLLTDFSSCLVAISPGSVLPSRVEREMLARQSIAMYLAVTGYYQSISAEEMTVVEGSASPFIC